MLLQCESHQFHFCQYLYVSQLSDWANVKISIRLLLRFCFCTTMDIHQKIILLSSLKLLCNRDPIFNIVTHA